MKRIFYQTRMYDYTNKEEAEKHIETMRNKGWYPKRQDDGDYIWELDDDRYKYSIEFYKEL